MSSLHWVMTCSSVGQKRPPILVVLENVLAPVSPRGDVVERIGKLYSDGAGHDGRNITEILLLC